MQKQKAEIGKAYRTAMLPELRSINVETKTLDFVASTPEPDRYGDVLNPEGFQLENFRKNPVFLFSHKSDEPPIGKCLRVWTEKSPAALCQTIQFADFPFASMIFDLYRQGFMRAISVGFLPLEAPKAITDADGRFSGYEFNNMELLESSAVAIPACPSALARMVSKNFSETDLARVFSDKEETPETLAGLKEEIAALKQEIATLKMPPRQESGDVCTIEQLIGVVKQAGDSIRADEANRQAQPSAAAEKTIESLEELGEALKPKTTDEITTLDELGEAVGESQIISKTGSRKWRDVR